KYNSNDKVCNMINDGGSCENAVSTYIVEKLALKTVGHPEPYQFTWLKKRNAIKDLASLEYSRETKGPYCTDHPTPDDIRRPFELERVVVDRTIKSQMVSLNPNQILTNELSPDMKQ
nr:reverse transcriptase domain-containing protein [Tanacetum cinerariifolium]